MTPTEMMNVAKQNQELAAILARLQNYKGVSLPDPHSVRFWILLGWSAGSWPMRAVKRLFVRDVPLELSPHFVEMVTCALLSSGNMLEVVAKNGQPTATGS